ncbi:substrate-binding periplasmic protein [Desulfobacter latus]|uniref:Transporter substrate-binding domain-containing protein n=1 Tax=Desulfobacter latus TaxID=2292 RepID=A0A850SWJ6_9BACT|nr:transporter substrate-binding domain-containing protein [Desulfobacter latus]NWH03793.1 transporter substrate-binding domain-containing protein [Desulfobacter latus]
MKKSLLSATTIFFIFFLAAGLSYAQDKKLNFGTLNWPPYFGETLENGGFMTEISTEAFKRTGWDYNLKFMNWNRAMGLAKKGKLTGVQGAYYTDERAKIFFYTNEITAANVVIFQKKGAGISYNSLKDLEGYTFGILRGFGYPDEFVQADFLKKEFTDKPEANILKLLKDRVDLIVGSKLVTIDIANSHYPDQAGQLDVLDPPLEKKPLYNIISKKIDNHQKILDDFNKGLEMLKEDGTYQAIMKKHGF